MGLKKLFSSSSNHKSKEDGLKNYEVNNKRHSSRSSTLSLAHSIKSSFTHNKDKHQSLNTNTTSNRYSQPSPPASITQQPRHSLNVTQNERHHYNPFITAPASAEISPVTPSESMRDVNDVVNVLRNSVSSEMLSTTFSIEEEQDHFEPPTTIPVAAVAMKEPNNFVLDKPISNEPMEIYPPNHEESTKYQVYDEEEEEGKHTVLTPDATNKENQDALYAELLQVASQLENLDPKNALEIKDKLTIINQTLTSAADKSQQLHNKLLFIIEISKQTILTTTDKNKELLETQERLNLELQQLQDGHASALNEKGELYESLLKENEALKEKYQNTQHELNSHVQTRNDIFNLIKKEDKEEMDDKQLVDKLKSLVTVLAAHQVLQQELKSKESALQEIELKYQQLITNSENDEQISERRKEAELQLANQITELKEQLQQEIDTRLSLEEKLKLEESSTSHILEVKEREHKAELLSQLDNVKKDTEEQLQKQELEITELKNTLESIKTENTEFQTRVKNFETAEASWKEQLQIANEQSENDIQQLKEKINAFKIENTNLKEELTDMETVSKEAAKTVIDENEKLEKRIQQLEEDSNHQIVSLNEQLASLTKDKAAMIDENKQLKLDLDAFESLKQENSSLSDLVKSLKDQIDELSKEKNTLKRQPSISNKKREQDQQEELMRMHTKAQLGLIEYLEGEENIVSAMATLKKGLEERL